MNDELAIQQTLSRYSAGVSQANWDMVVATFMPDGVWDIPGLGAKFEGQDAIRAGLLHLCGQLDYLVQINAPAIIDIDGDTATAQSVIRECGKLLGRDLGLDALGLYADRLVRTHDGWRFAERVFDLKGTQCYPLIALPQGVG